ncbi:MAG: aminotransferase class I/II-fold pyridoxal phosphate-dependent enzyme [Candidatus Nitronauta litoralis]|uniref:Aminotransferase class I/II-fold pyridoxal phosphate-dependent enzyme n=1 Tax=Candidatus Nitronauta litoralis TaxID=2705533 RepID=A0A7T0G1P2_9BACT|nr:MAG: aminotransferase class I/II-fold pyridoxal phosphate-dependent enzyme [Candidatus Nitronauta litoralis]
MEEQLETIRTIDNSFSFNLEGKSKASTFEFPEHGGDPAVFKPYSNGSLDNLLDFSVCLNPMGPPESLAHTILGAIHRTGAYPAPFANSLKLRLGDYFGLKPENFLVTHGSTQLIYTLPELWKPSQSVCIIAPCFSEYEKSFELRGIETHFFLLDPEKDFDLRWEVLEPYLKSIENLGGVILGHPASPSGTLCNKDLIEKLLRFTNKNQNFLIVDETFIDFTEQENFLPEIIHDNPYLILIRTFSKFFSIPGIRLGYGIMNPSIQKQLENFIPPWSAGSIELEVGLMCLDETEYMKETRKFLAKERARIGDLLNSFSTVQLFPSDSCSLLFKLTDNSIYPETLYKNLFKENILIRNCGNFRGLNHRFFRVGIRTKDENTSLINALKSCLG